jgi:hypothetical protein
MPLTRANDRYTSDVQGVNFLMQDGPAEIICRISLETLSRLGRMTGLTEPIEIFENSRETIERAASNKYDRTSRLPYEVMTVAADDLGLGDA